MRFKTFLESQWQHSKMEFADMMEWIESNALKFIKREQPIFRGVWNKDAEGLYNGATLNRKSANTNNDYYNLWLSNHPNWSQFPKRNKSFICTTDEYKASDYGDVYYAIPQDSSVIGVCPHLDIWDSFKDTPTALGIRSDEGHVSTFADCIDDIFKNVLGHAVPDDDWDGFQKFAESITMFDVMEKCKDEWFYAPLIKYAKAHNINDVDELLLTVLDPKRNNFTIQKAADFVAHGRREVWMSGAVLFVNDETYGQIMSEFK